MNLTQPVTVLPGVGPKKAELLNKLGVYTLLDLLHYYPFRHQDLSRTVSIDQLIAGQTVTLIGSIVKISTVYTRSRKSIQKAVFSDGRGTLDITWFNQPYLVKTLSPPVTVSLSGKPALYRGRLTLVSPTVEINRSSAQALKRSNLHTGRLVPIYPQTAGLSSTYLRSRLHTLLNQLPPQTDWLPPSLLHQHRLTAYDTALRQIHFPDSPDLLAQAIYRLKFDELIEFQLRTQRRRYLRQNSAQSPVIPPHPQALQAFIKHLPFRLTQSQNLVLNEICQDLQSSVSMNRLLQGEVGSGKTVVAAAAMYLVHLNGLKSVLMAPTAILARQHHQTLTQLFARLKLSVGLSTRTDSLGSDSDPVIVGTHALLHRPLPAKIGLVVIDEQHRFGVHQRTLLIRQQPQPHVLSMTATPIPRTLALTLYSDQDLSTLTDLPHQKPPVKTWLVPAAKRTAAYSWIQTQIKQHQAQVFVVCPLIDPSLNASITQIKAAESTFLELKSQIFPQLRLGLLHGRLPDPVKNQTLADFRNHHLDLLVTTPVIEVGIDIPKATIMVIEASERFGLAQLHQLRGRVGRGLDPGYCLLFTTQSQSSVRLKHLTQIHQGLRLAELDLSLRGQGEILGLKQSGHDDFKLASLADLDLIQLTHQAAVQIIKHDPTLKHLPALKSRLESHLEKANPAL